MVTGIGQYTEHMTLPNTLYTRTLRGPHPHARVKSVDVTNAEKFPGVHAVLYRGNLPALYQDVNLGSGPPTRGLFVQNEAYDPRSDRWTSLTPMPTPTDGLVGAAFVDGPVHIPGGSSPWTVAPAPSEPEARASLPVASRPTTAAD